MSFGNCKGCLQQISSYDWCKSCNYKHFQDEFNNWTSGNEIIDEKIKKIQLNSSSYQEVIEWIPENRLIIQNCIGKGRFGTVYKAIWKDGYIGYWDYDENCWKRYDKNCTVAVKVLHNSKDIRSDLLNQMFSAQNYNVPGLIRYYGITQDSTTKDYAMITQYLESNVQTYLNKSNLTTNLLWLEKLEILMDVSSTLLKLHNSGLCHENLHTNNILCNMDNNIILCDLGLTHPPNKLNPKYELKTRGDSNSYGLLNFIPPEIINGKNYTKESDIYCFGMILWEISCQKTFFDSNKKMENNNNPIVIKKPKLFDHNTKLPYNLKLLISRCWDHEPRNRPTIKLINKQLNDWWIGSWNKNTYDIITPFLNQNINVSMIKAKKFDPIYINNILEIDDSNQKHFKSILSKQQTLSSLHSDSTNTEETHDETYDETYEESHQSSFTDTNAHIDANTINPYRDVYTANTLIDINTTNIDANIKNTHTYADININTNRLKIDDEMDKKDEDNVDNIDNDIDFRFLSTELISSNKKDSIIMPGTLPKVELYYSKDNVFTKSDIILYNTYFEEIAIKIHHYLVVNNISSLCLQRWKMIMRAMFFNILVYIYFIINLFILNRIVYVVIGYNLFNEEKMRKIMGI